jgi:hypothetical protein
MCYKVSIHLSNISVCVKTEEASFYFPSPSFLLPFVLVEPQLEAVSLGVVVVLGWAAGVGKMNPTWWTMCLLQLPT